MMACLAAHDKAATDAAFMKFFPLIELDITRAAVISKVRKKR